MKSKNCSDKIDLARDLPTTAEDVAALRRAGVRSGRLDLVDYLRFLAQFPAPSAAELRAKGGARAAMPFELVDLP